MSYPKSMFASGSPGICLDYRL
uniref:NAC transcription factors 88 n=1 Tax=Rhizophora mucronata TaxID=61149 RepID=A0A2P2PUA9_RHIMU